MLYELSTCKWNSVAGHARMTGAATETPLEVGGTLALTLACESPVKVGGT